MINNIPQRENCHIDAMASSTSLVGLDFGQDEYHFVVQVLHSSAISNSAYQDNPICTHLYSGKWFAHISNYLKIGSFLEDASKSLHVQIQKLATRYILLSGISYRRSSFAMFNNNQDPYALEKAHSGFGGDYFGGKSLVHKIIHMEYFWEKMEQYSFPFVKKCPQCQKHSNLIRSPS